MGRDSRFANRKFRLLCNELRLQPINGMGPILSGPGEIWRSSSDTIKYRMFVSTGINEALDVRRVMEIGSVVPLEAYFKIEADEIGSRTWFGERSIPSFQHDGTGAGVVHGTLDCLKMTDHHGVVEERDTLTLWVSGDIGYPANLREHTTVRRGKRVHRQRMSLKVAEVQGSDYLLEIASHKRNTVVTYTALDGPVPERTRARLCETLQFVLNRPIAPTAAQLCSGGTDMTTLLTPGIRRSGEGFAMPPVDIRPATRGADAWTLFRHYFAYVRAHDGPPMHPASRHVASVIEASAGSINTQVLALSVATEGVASVCLPDWGTPGPKEIEQIDKLIGDLESSIDTLSEPMRNRVRGAISAMKQPRAADRLHEFVERMGLSRSLLKSWKDLRNRAAHGAATLSIEVSDLVRLRNAVLYLLYSVVLHTVGYDGPRVDYSAPGWPTVARPEPGPDC